MNLAVITGASSGIGEATAKVLAHSGYDLLLVARRKEKLNKIKSQLINNKIHVFTHSLDVQNEKDIHAFRDKFHNELKNISVLVNSAGLACGVEKVQNAKTQDWDQMIDTNIKGLLYMTRAMLPYFINNNRGDIINIGSVAGRWVYQGGTVYCASKFAVRAISEGLRLDLMGLPLRVTNIEPGMVETEFSTVRLKDKEKAKKVYENMTPLHANDIAETVVWCLKRPSHVNIQELVIFPTDQAGVGSIYRSCNTQVNKNNINAGNKRR